MSNDVQSFYDSHSEQEWMRLVAPGCQIEYASTMRLIERYFPSSGRIADIGGGPGRYAVELARRGHAVTLADLSAEEIALARGKIAAAGVSAERFVVADARDLKELETAGFDAALLLGPMYHLTDTAGRAAALGELVRVLKPGGVAIIAYLNAWGILRTGIVDFPAWFRELPRVRSLLDGRSFTADELAGFTESYWTTPPVALAEVRSAGLEVVSRAGAEGFAGGMASQVESLAAQDREAFGNLVRLGAETCELEPYRDNTDHLLIVVRR
jgi:S-adenosylmethionine-dependent methyltransferase